jgi:hypothetical protein
MRLPNGPQIRPSTGQMLGVDVDLIREAERLRSEIKLAVRRKL